MINENIFQVLSTSAAYFADISPTGRLLRRYITYGGLEASEMITKSFHSAENITEAIPVFTALGIKDLKNVMVLPKWNYGIARSKPVRTRSRVANSLINERGREELSYVLNV
jgi:hypothetical protein